MPLHLVSFLLFGQMPDLSDPASDAFAAEMVRVVEMLDIDADGYLSDSEASRIESTRRLLVGQGVDFSEPVPVDSAAMRLQKFHFEGRKAVAEGRLKDQSVLGKVWQQRSEGKVYQFRKFPLPPDWKGVDNNLDGQVSYCECPDIRRRQFNQLDRNGDGFLEPRELKHQLADNVSQP